MCVVEGWATGYTVHKATNRPVIVAFSAGGLRHVCEALRREKNPDRMLIAADNDRWSRIVQAKGEDIPNPGVYWAKVAAEASGAEVAIPDFEDLNGNPVDFDDLRIREGMAAVGKWLDPKMADKATTVAKRKSTAVAKTGKDAKPPAEPGEGASWRDTAPFRPLGHNMKVCYFASKLSGQILPVTTADFRRSSEYYHFGGSGMVAEALQAVEEAGVRHGLWRSNELIAAVHEGRRVRRGALPGPGGVAGRRGRCRPALGRPHPRTGGGEVHHAGTVCRRGEDLPPSLPARRARDARPHVI